MTEVAKSLQFAPPLLALADRIIEGMTLGGQLQYNGVHLRIEKDARDWAMIMGGQQVVWHGYIKTMKQVGFDNATRLYVASGMLTYGASVDMDRTIGYLKHVGVCSEVHHKERYIPQSEIESECSPPGSVWAGASGSRLCSVSVWSAALSPGGSQSPPPASWPGAYH